MRIKFLILLILIFSPLFLPRTAQAQSGIVGDANGDGKVDASDYIFWIRSYNRNLTGPSNGDFNNNGNSDGIDFVLWLKNFGTIATLTPTPTTYVMPQHKIGVQQTAMEGPKFFNRQTGLRFVPRGNNFVRLGPVYNADGTCVDYHSTFDVQLPDTCVQKVYDPVQAESALAYQQASNYNIVRVFINHIHAVGGGFSIDMNYIRNVKDFIKKAKAHDIYVLLNFSYIPWSYHSQLPADPNIGWSNSYYLTQTRIDDKKRYIVDFINALKSVNTDFDHIFGYDLQNEIFFVSNEPPFSLRSGTVTTANGVTYDLSKESERNQLMSANIVYYINQLTSAIKLTDPTALVTMSFFNPHAALAQDPPKITDARWAMVNPEEGGSNADFIDLHLYPNLGTLSYLVNDFNIPSNTRKPIIMGEFGAYKPIYNSIIDAAYAMRDWQIESCQYGFDGWLFWTWDSAEQPEFYNVVESSGAINGVLAPVARPDPCN